MTKKYKWLVKHGKVMLLHRTIGLFGEQWECFGVFDDKAGNAARGKQIIKLLNECATHTEIFNGHD